MKESKLNTNAKLFFILAGGLSVTSIAGRERVRKWQVKLAVLKKNEAQLRFYGGVREKRSKASLLRGISAFVGNPAVVVKPTKSKPIFERI